MNKFEPIPSWLNCNPPLSVCIRVYLWLSKGFFLLFWAHRGALLQKHSSDSLSFVIQVSIL